MKKIGSLLSLCLLTFTVSSQVNTTPALLEKNSNGIQIYQSKGFESEIEKTSKQETVTVKPVFDPYQFIEDVERKIVVHRENGNFQEANALEQEVRAVKQSYSIK